MRNKIIIISIMLSFFMIMIPSFSDNVKASSIDYPLGFEGVVAGIPYVDSFIKTGVIGSTGSCLVQSTPIRSGNRALRITRVSNQPFNSYMNLTYSKSEYLTDFSFWLKSDVTAGGGHYMYFFNRTDYLAGGISKYIIGLRFSYEASQTYSIKYINDVGSEVSILDATSFATFKYVGFSITDDIGSVDYTGHTTTVSGIAKNCSSINSSKRIDLIISVNSIATNVHYYTYDDLNFTLSDSYEGGTTSCGISFNGYDKLGIDNTPNTMDLNHPDFQKINYGLNYGYLKYVTLCINPAMYSADSDPNNYNLECLGFDLGGADCLDLDGYNYRLIWEANIDLGDRVEGIPSGRNIDCLFTHSTKVGSSAYWQVCVGSTIDTDLDSDGKTSFKLWNDARTVIDYDVGVSFYFDATTRYEPSDSIFTDSLGLQNYISKNSTGYIYDINQPEGIVCSYLLSELSKTYQCKIVVMKNTSTYYVNFTGLSFPSGVRGLSPVTIGKYTFKLYNYHYIYNITAWVTGTPSSYFISSSPTITNPFESYNIVYRYYNIVGYDGNIGVFSDYTRRGSFVYADTSYSVIVNTTSSKTYPSTSLINEYLTLFVNSSLNQPVAYATHWIRDNNVLENNLYVSPAELSIYQGNPDNYAVEIMGSHVFPGSQISIFVQGREMFSVRDDQTFNRTFAPPQPDTYNISLRLYQNGTWITLKYCYLTVADLGAEGGQPVYTFGIDPPFSYFVGIFIIILMTLSPLLVVGVVKKDFNLSSIPQFLYLVMAIIGFIVTIIMGLFPLWSIAVLVLLCTVILAILWMKGPGPSE